jgi:hypothetical protein
VADAAGQLQVERRPPLGGLGRVLGQLGVGAVEQAQDLGVLGLHLGSSSAT